MNTTIRIALFLGLVISTYGLCAQANIFTEISINPGQLSSTQTVRYNKIIAATEYSEIKYVQIGAIFRY